MQGGGRVSRGRELARQGIDIAFRRGKDDTLGHLVARGPMMQEPTLMREVVDLMQTLLDIGGARSAGDRAGRRQDENPRPANPRLQRGGDALQGRQHEGSSLSSARLGGAEKVTA